MRRMAGWLGVLTALLTGLVVLVGIDRAFVRSNSVQLFGGIVSRVEIDKPVVALTFDDGPRLDDLDEILEMLARRGVRATFFVTGSRLAAQPESGHRLVAAGHELGNHSWSHERMVLRSARFVRREVEETDTLIRFRGSPWRDLLPATVRPQVRDAALVSVANRPNHRDVGHRARFLS